MQKLIQLIFSDLYRYKGQTGLAFFLKEYLKNKGFRLSFWYRICHHLRDHKILLFIPKLFYSRCKSKLVADIHYKTSFGPGLCIYHVFAIAIDTSARFGKNLVLSHGVTVGGTLRGSKKGVPTIGDNVCIGPGSIIIGGITVGNNVIIGGNSVVTKDIPDNAVVVGNPAKIISYEGAGEYVRHTDYQNSHLAGRDL